MALGSTNINTTMIGTEIGSASHLISELVGAAGLNKFSFYAPGTLSIDGSKNLVLTPPVTIFKLGDFRSYNHTANTSAPPSGAGTDNWGPGGSTIAFTQVWHPFDLNIKEITGYDNYVTMNFYFTTVDRTAETNRKHQQIFPITYNGITPLVGHTRQTAFKCDANQNCSVTGLNIAGLATPDANIYIETFISDNAGGRILNLGNTRTDGYTTQAVHQLQTPIISGTSSQEVLDLPPVLVPVNYVHLFPRTYSINTPACSIGDTIQSQGSTGYNTYVKLLGIHVSPAGSRIVAVDSCDLIITIKDDGGATVHTETLVTGVPLVTTGVMYHLIGNLTGYSWAYGDIGYITLANVEFSTITPVYVDCI
jgi:hypothetical protein